MRPLLASLSEVQVHLVALSLALMVDIDGTISLIAPTPQQAAVDPSCRRALRALARKLTLVAAVSGRPAQEAAHLVGVAEMVYIGNHGLERWQQGEVRANPKAAALAWAIAEALEQIKEKIELPGVLYEQKGLTASVHYRLSSDPELARQSILRVAQELAARLPVQVREGRMVVEIRPAVATNKGTAVEELLEEHKPGGALYIGDDLTDVDAFRAVHAWAQQEGKGGIAVAVLGEETPQEVIEAADYSLYGLEEVRRFLNWLDQGST